MCDEVSGSISSRVWLYLCWYCPVAFSVMLTANRLTSFFLPHSISLVSTCQTEWINVTAALLFALAEDSMTRASDTGLFFFFNRTSGCRQGQRDHINMVSQQLVLWNCASTCFSEIRPYIHTCLQYTWRWLYKMWFSRSEALSSLLSY